jgi:hypothetical protein
VGWRQDGTGRYVNEPQPDWPPRLTPAELTRLLEDIREERVIFLQRYPERFQRYHATLAFPEIPQLLAQCTDAWLARIGTIYGRVDEAYRKPDGEPLVHEWEGVETYVFTRAHLVHVDDWELIRQRLTEATR